MDASLPERMDLHPTSIRGRPCGAQDTAETRAHLTRATPARETELCGPLEQRSLRPPTRLRPHRAAPHRAAPHRAAPHRAVAPPRTVPSPRTVSPRVAPRCVAELDTTGPPRPKNPAAVELGDNRWPGYGRPSQPPRPTPAPRHPALSPRTVSPHTASPNSTPPGHHRRKTPLPSSSATTGREGTGRGVGEAAPAAQRGGGATGVVAGRRALRRLAATWSAGSAHSTAKRKTTRAKTVMSAASHQNGITPRPPNSPR